ncbi:glycoside hydrolase family 15 protein [Rhodococcus aetherivorans]|uniref:Glycoside hydrolase family 15 protein n=1 Tax=Rhodococcus aetherivorans TaxID=191292 RepID=A0AA46SC34_9NOCA|nr:glycoside hydrolase family 15 protein [Rhodococcus aetherivorans]MDV6295253.1 glycoside hydrolase family 15 protein [Rhodococcus aetherivorans]UYF96573.1 glycoside hydrolase family 15 protein [Rhodococcus aetherivorans]
MQQRIEDYALIGDLHTAALVGRDGSIDWLCLPRFDSPACFAALLGDDEAGRWLLAPTDGGLCTRRAYRRDTLVLDTEWVTATGTVRVTDCMPVRAEAADVVRVVEGLAGSVRMNTELRLRFDYGHVVPWVRRVPGSLTAVAGPDAAWLRTPVPLHGHDMRTTAQFEVRAGESVPFVLTYALSYGHTPRPLDALRAIADTQAYWTEWIERCDYTGEYPEAVHRSLITLEALTYRPTGGILAAATTSLPEQIGGSRNWDYRYCWLRDATFTLQALLGCGFVAEARAWRNWLVRAVAGNPADLQMMYQLDGARRVPEYEVPWLSGYEASVPVRIGNAAAGQFQLDVWGEVLDGLHLARQSGLRGDPAWDIEVALLDFLEGHWQEPDNGLWEVRGPARPFVHSKVMAWAGVDRGIRAVERFGLPGPVDRWRVLREQIRTEILTKGFDPHRGTFTQFYGSRGVDAASLLIPRTGFLPWDDPRVLGTVATVERELSRDGFLLRYRPELEHVDGIAEPEGAFLACSFWLADALHGAGRTRDAHALFERLLSVRNDVGLLAEEYDPHARRQLGNVPQAFSHVALVNTARHLAGHAVHTHRPTSR